MESLSSLHVNEAPKGEGDVEIEWDLLFLSTRLSPCFCCCCCFLLFFTHSVTPGVNVCMCSLLLMYDLIWCVCLVTHRLHMTVLFWIKVQRSRLVSPSFLCVCVFRTSRDDDAESGGAQVSLLTHHHYFTHCKPFISHHNPVSTQWKKSFFSILHSWDEWLPQEWQQHRQQQQHRYQ